MKYGGIVAICDVESQDDLVLVDMGGFWEQIEDQEPPQVVLDTLKAYEIWSDKKTFPLVAWRGRDLYYFSLDPEISPLEITAIKTVFAVRRYRGEAAS